MAHDWDGSADYVPAPVVKNIRPDYSYEDILISEVRRLEAENATLQATLRLVREVLDRGGDPGRVVGNLGTV